MPENSPPPPPWEDAEPARTGVEAALEPLSPRHRRFVEAYVAHPRDEPAALVAGFAAKDARIEGVKLRARPEIADAIAQLRAYRQQQLEVSQLNVLREYARIAFSDPVLLFDDAGHLLPIEEQPEDIRHVLQEVTVTNKLDGPVIKVKLMPKVPALDALSKHLGLFEADNKQQANAPDREVSDLEFARRIAHILHEAGNKQEEDSE